ncbi:MAG: sigma-70 family RNA polymerase sigma factor [Pyrinomonadaceae bacterium]|nr:sigma-70 family RNA polymerase sigma factor [Pyrinomonadaceae bacterium]
MAGSQIKRKDTPELLKDFEDEAMPFTQDLFRVAMFLKRNRDMAEDLVQETMMQAFKSFHRYKLGTNCKAWLTTIMYNTHYKQLKKQTRMQLVEDKDELIAKTVPFEASVPERITDEDVLEALEKVPDHFKEIVVLCDVEGFSYKEIASIMDIPIGTVMSRLHRGRKVLRNELTVYARSFGIGNDGEDKASKAQGGKSS